MRKELVAVTIPIYKQYPDANELISLNQTIRILNRYPIIFFAPQSLDTSFYENHCANKINFKIKRFNNDYFDGIQGYNKLMLSKEFYFAFNNYKYILICQLDAYVFRDELEYWCNKGYDYIGAPYAFVDMDAYPMKVLTKYRALLKIIKRYFPWSYTFKQVGNGGLSLRNVKKTLFLLNFKKLHPKLWKTLMEDNFFQYWGNVMFPFFKLPDVIEAAKFSIELDPEKTFQSIGNKLPFGCHAYMRYQPEFWKKHIEFTDYNNKPE
jgi:hypothetical protein